MSAGDKARGLHRDALGWDPRRQGTPIAQAKAAADARRVELADIYALQGKPFMSWAPDDLLRKVESMAAAAGMTRGATDTGVWASLLAVCLEGWCAAARAQEFDVASGDAA